MMRSLLFVPADSERKLSRASDSGADALVLDLEDSVLPAAKARGREMLAEYVREFTGSSQIWVRVNELGGPDLLKDLAALVPLNPQGILFPKIRGPEDLDVISHYLDMAEEIGGVHKGSIGVIAICTETPSAVLRMGELVMRRRARLKGLIWGAEDLSSAIGAGDPRAVDGGWRDLYKYARSQCLLAAHALEVAPIDTVFVDFKDPDGCRESSMTARFDGFSGKVAIHPDQVPIINAAFSPSAAELERARKIVAAFDQGLGAIAFEGKMLDVPHLKAAQRILANSIPESMRKS